MARTHYVKPSNWRRKRKTKTNILETNTKLTKATRIKRRFHRNIRRFRVELLSFHSKRDGVATKENMCSYGLYLKIQRICSGERKEWPRKTSYNEKVGTVVQRCIIRNPDSLSIANSKAEVTIGTYFSHEKIKLVERISQQTIAGMRYLKAEKKVWILENILRMLLPPRTAR